jgi:hypothetical protein
MRSSQSASLYLRIRSADGGWVYARSVTASNGRLRPLHALVDGKSIHCAEGTDYLRFSLNGKRIGQPVGTDASMGSADKAMRMPLSKQRNKHIWRALVEAAKLEPRQSHEHLPWHRQPQLSPVS